MFHPTRGGTRGGRDQVNNNNNNSNNYNYNSSNNNNKHL